MLYCVLSLLKKTSSFLSNSAQKDFFTIMKISLYFLLVSVWTSSITAFTVPSFSRWMTPTTRMVPSTASAEPTMAEAGVPPAHSEPATDISEEDIPKNLPSAVGKDYIPLATMLATGQLAEADQVRR
jgi:hypothetical protein